MPGDIFLKEGTIATLEASGGSLTTGTAVASTTNLDCRSGGLAGAVQNINALFELVCAWVTVPAVGAVAAELYLVPALDGTNFPNVNTTGGSSVIPYTTYKGNFPITVLPVTTVNMRFVSDAVRLRPLLYRVYILNRSAQTISSTWTLKVMSARIQYN